MFHKGKYYVTFKRGFDEHKKDINVVVDKVFEKDCVVWMFLINELIKLRYQYYIL